MKKLSFEELKKIVLCEAVDDYEDWEWCVADASKSNLTPVCYQSNVPWPNDISVELMPRGYYIGYCQTLRRDEAEKLLGMMEKYKEKTMPQRKTRYVVVSREEFKKNSYTAADYWKSEVSGGSFYRG